MKVIAKMQGPNESEPVDMVWAKDTDDLGVMLAVAQLLDHIKDVSPWSPLLLEIRIEP